MKLTKITLPSLTYYHRFLKDDGSIFRIQTTKEDYEQLATANHIDPNYPNMKWLSSFAGHYLPIGYYADEGSQILVNLTGQTIPIEKDELWNNELTLKGVERVNKFKNGFGI